MANIADIAARIHSYMCENPGFGYSWDERYGGPQKATLDIDGRKYSISIGDYDCSSSTITAWKTALKGTPYEGALEGASYTGNMRSVFVRSGLFEWVGVNSARRGDLYLNEGSHVAMCQGNGLLSEFSGNEHGGVYGGKRGDQTGWESHICGYYWYPWDGCLRYNGRADGFLPKEENDLKPIYNEGGDVYRLYNPNTSDHMLTIDKAESDALRKVGWEYEGVAFKAPKGGTHAVYRLYNPNAGDHHWTVDFDEAAKLQKSGWNYEGVQWFGVDSGAPAFRMYNPNTGDHFITTDKTEREGLKKAGWSYEGVAFYV